MCDEINIPEYLNILKKYIWSAINISISFYVSMINN